MGAPSHSQERQLALEFLGFLNKSRSSYEAVATTKDQLIGCGFQQLSELEDWVHTIRPGGRYFLTRNQSTIVAFTVGKNIQSDKSGFSILAAHTDSPCLKIKPISNIQNAGFLQVGVECYGGGLWHTWFDRDLGLSGRVLVKTPGGAISRIVGIRRPILRIPTLAIHLNRNVNAEGFKFNTEDELVPILATEVKYALEGITSGVGPNNDHHPALIHILSTHLGCNMEDIVGFDLSLADVQDATLGGAYDEFIFGGRLDNLMMSWCCLHALLQTVENPKKDDSNDSHINICFLFDNEEIGSETTQGAGSNILENMLRRIKDALFDSCYFHLDNMVRRSFIVSCDMAHACHPNYQAKHEKNHRPGFHRGLVIKDNCNFRYATTVESNYVANCIANANGIPLQKFVVRNDTACGSTIGPILSTKLGIRCIDVGIAQTSMHSIRETAGTTDLIHAVTFLEQFLRKFPSIDGTLVTDHP